MDKCMFRDCHEKATHLVDYLRGDIPIYGIRACEMHVNNLIDEHEDDTSTLFLLAATPLTSNEA